MFAFGGKKNTSIKASSLSHCIPCQSAQYISVHVVNEFQLYVQLQRTDCILTQARFGCTLLIVNSPHVRCRGDGVVLFFLCEMISLEYCDSTEVLTRVHLIPALHLVVL